ncbi:hypothetical protein [Natronolimnohabitans innermongolicus]|uniref:Uncharacterized protein n=1 Tax=Natronolimnohabitans innermongolicus JCM 12255 TaxID=1227499 RepID=L9X4X1_9EURY|nr:hypothetical protein [Natronolimnohabitans innermongolicus]ELY56667.1 hypothetical protein C493_09845 [Natronolimnohabitans innermongolicus JCM 12255]
MIGLVRTLPFRESGRSLLPVALAAVVAVLGAIFYLELVFLLLETLQ